jgi:hypothetical protein
MSVPMRAATVSATPARPLRLDVTELLREWRVDPERYHGLALLGSGDSDTGACYTSGLRWGSGPRLEVYLAPKEPKDGGADADAARSDADQKGALVGEEIKGDDDEVDIDDEDGGW